MFSFYKIVLYTRSITNAEIAKDYYEKCFDGLKDLSKRSNRISQYIIIIILLTLYSKYFSKVKILDNQIDIELLKILAPTALSYFVLEWLMIAKRRRDYIYAIQQLSFGLYNINASEDEQFFPGIDPNTLNVMPYSFMCEILTIAKPSKFNLIVRRIAIFTIPILLFITLFFSFYNYWNESNMQFHVIWPSNWQLMVDTVGFYTCLIISCQAIFWIVYHYYTEFRNLAEIKEMIRQASSDQPLNGNPT